MINFVSDLPKHHVCQIPDKTFPRYAKSQITNSADKDGKTLNSNNFRAKTLKQFSDLFSMKKTKVTPFWQFPMLNK